MPKIVNLEQRQLLVFSEVIKDYPFLEKTLSENETIDESDLKNHDENERNFLKTFLPNIIKQATDEWKGNKDCIDKGVVSEKCSLCHTPNRYIYHIINQENGNTMNVGSDCIQKFDFNFSLSKGTTLKQHVDRQKRERYRLQKLSKINEKYPNIVNTLSEWKRLVSDCLIILPLAIEEPYLQYINEIQYLIDEYKDGSMGNEVFAKIDRLINIIQEKNVDIDAYVTNNIDNMFVPTRRIKYWLLENKKDNIVAYLKKTGRIDKVAIKEIHESDFINGIIPLINKGLKEKGFIIEKADFEKGMFLLKHGSMVFHCLFRDFLAYISGFAFNEEDVIFTKDSLLDLCHIYEKDSIDTLLDEISKLFKGTTIGIGYNDFASDDVVVFIRNKAEHDFAVLKMSVFLKAYKKYVLYDTKPDLEKGIKSLEDVSSRRYKMKEYGDFLYRNYGIKLRDLKH